MNNLFISAIFAAPSTKSSPVDVWGNVKIPKIEYYENKVEPDNNGWFNTVPGDDDFAAYPSFVGTPINIAKDETTTTDYDFHLQTECLQLTCASVNYTKTERVVPEELPSDALNQTGSDGMIWWSENDIANRWNKTPETLKPFSFSYATLGNGFSGSVSCSVKNSYVEVEVLCAGNSTCRAVKVRRSQLPQLPPAITFMDLGQGWHLSVFMDAFMSTIGGEEGSVDPRILHDYLMDPSLVVPRTDYYNTTAIQISDEALSERLGQLINSYWTCVCDESTITAGIDANTSYFWDKNTTFEPSKNEFGSSNVPGYPGYYNWTYDPSPKSKVWSSQGHKSEHIEVITAHKPWSITLSIASLFLIAFSLVPPLVRHFLTKGPDIAMNFSSLATRNNSHVPIPTGGSFLPAADRFRLVKDLRLRFADADGKSDVGNLVIASQGVGKVEYLKVRKGKLYE